MIDRRTLILSAAAGAVSAVVARERDRLPRNLRLLRGDFGRDWLANESGLSVAKVARIEGGTAADRVTLERLARALWVRPQELFAHPAWVQNCCELADIEADFLAAAGNVKQSPNGPDAAPAVRSIAFDSGRMFYGNLPAFAHWANELKPQTIALGWSHCRTIWARYVETT